MTAAQLAAWLRLRQLRMTAHTVAGVVCVELEPYDGQDVYGGFGAIVADALQSALDAVPELCPACRESAPWGEWSGGVAGVRSEWARCPSCGATAERSIGRVGA